VSGGNLNGTPWDAKRASQNSHQFLISGAVNWWCGDSHAQGPVMLADDLTARSPRHNPNLEH
jgi:hypothetical protein